MLNVSQRLLLGILLLLALASCGETNESPTQAAKIGAGSAIEHAASTPTPTARVISQFAVYRAVPGTAVASVEERIDASDVVVLAQFLSVTGDQLRFSAVEYIKGKGATEFTVQATGADAPQIGEQSVLFLSMPESGGGRGASGQQSPPSDATFGFTDSTTRDYEYVNPGDPPPTYAGTLPEGYGPTSQNPVWLPVESPSAGGRAAGSSGTTSPASIVLTEVTPGGPTPCSQDDLTYYPRDFCASEVATSSVTISLGDLREKVAWVVGAEDGNQRYEGCVAYSLYLERVARDWLAYHGTPKTLNSHEESLKSGLGAGHAIYENLPSNRAPSYDPNAWAYDRLWLLGEHADLFSAQIVDDDTVTSNGFGESVTTARPLIEGTYRFTDRTQPYRLIPCDYLPDYTFGLHWTVTVIAPPGTVHEAFFDPATTTAGVGYLAGSATTTGVLDAATFGEGATSATIESIVYASSTVTLRVTPANALANHGLDFIALDGSVALSLDPDVAATPTGALSWAVTSAPWAAGDELMLRVKRDPVLDTTFTAGRADTGQNWVTGYSDGFVGSIAGSGFTVGGTATAVEAVLWFDHHPVGEVRLGLTAAVDLSGYTLTFSDSAGREILVLDGNADEVDSSGRILEWDVPELPWADGETVSLVIREAE